MLSVPFKTFGPVGKRKTVFSHYPFPLNFWTRGKEKNLYTQYKMKTIFSKERTKSKLHWEVRFRQQIKICKIPS